MTPTPLPPAAAPAPAREEPEQGYEDDIPSDDGGEADTGSVDPLPRDIAG